MYVVLQVFGGLLVNVGTLGRWLNWMQYLSCARYSINVCTQNISACSPVISFKLKSIARA